MNNSFPRNLNCYFYFFPWRLNSFFQPFEFVAHFAAIIVVVGQCNPCAQLVLFVMDLKSARKKICTKFFEIFSSRCHFDGLQTSLSYVPWPTLSRVNQTITKQTRICQVLYLCRRWFLCKLQHILVLIYYSESTTI